jgi:hypothetical protein
VLEVVRRMCYGRSVSEREETEMDEETVTCTQCSAEISPLAVFPGGICVECYAQTPEANAPLTAEGLADLFRGTVK